MSFIAKLKNDIKNNPRSRISCLIAFIYSILGFNRIRCAKGNRINKRNCFMKRCHIEVYGKNNLIDFGGSANYLTNCHIYVSGNNNRIILGERNVFVDGELWIEDDNGEISFGKRNRIEGRTHIAVIEGTSVIFGNECLFSSDVVFRTGDSHSILDSRTGNRINPSKSIKIADKVWFGNRAIILKGVEIESDCIVGSGAVVTKSVQANSIVAGNPAKVIKQGVKWDIHRQPIA